MKRRVSALVAGIRMPRRLGEGAPWSFALRPNGAGNSPGRSAGDSAADGGRGRAQTAACSVRVKQFRSSR